jgi:hypothetical protein
MTSPTRVLLVSGDLAARARVEAATERVGGELRTCRLEDLSRVLKEEQFDLVVGDLDSGGTSLIEALRDHPTRVVGYYSHVDDELGRTARAAGLEPIPRGRFWRELDVIIG